uniref:Ovule protein n=1 Tax=Loa loa TaxID=7209 RepID=A0A1I7VPS3_LOALO
MKCNQTLLACNNLQSSDLEKAMNMVASHHSKESISRPLIQLKQYSTSQTNYFVSSDPSMNNDMENEIEITRL